tara:strand:+ start:4257 stop:4748 length:492 start_codon:yes stop_codon:yes gene_type:complete
MNLNEKNLNGMALSIESHQWIHKNIKKESTIIELGAGYGTKELAKFYNVYAVEDDKRFIGLSAEVKYIHAPLKNDWFDIEAVKAGLPEKYDLLIIDGPGGNKSNRNLIFDFYDEIFLQNIPILIDDTHCLKYLNPLSEWAQKNSRSLETIKGFEKSFSISFPS